MPADSQDSGSTSRRVWQLAWPTIISNLLFTTVGFLHIKIASPLGASAVAAVTTGHRVFFLIQAVLMGLSVATAAVVARNWGAQQPSEAAMATWTSMAMAVFFGFVLGLPALLVPEVIVGWFGLDAETTASAASFIFWLGLFNVFSALNTILSTALRSTGDVITPLLFLFCSSVLNIIAAWVLATGVGGLPAFGVQGIGLGGSAAAAIITTVFIAIWWRGAFNIKPVKRLRINVLTARQLVSIGIPSVVEQGFVQTAFLVFFGLVATYGTKAYAAYGIGISLVSFSIVIGFGFGIAAATLVGQQLGAGKPELAMKAGWRGLRMALIAMVSLSIVMAFYAGELATFMIEDTEAAEFTTAFIYVIALCQPLMAVDAAIGGALRGAGDTRFPLLATVSGIMMGRLLPASLILMMELSIYWMFLVMFLDYLIKAILLLWRYRSRKWMQVKVR
ncbi:MATE family efflux transporter [Halioglobus maricola]|uniref:Multidrug-efflux transporter n=1 Tax=Halioglobus maricola TaxID=2601894 RepID=A0A5P9NLP0_9GAMM|nr:MATE family efflux transporter [Halioglobus maricola]QFU76750.1 MATE family efflux transporter [Halioglobus maricola]